MKQLQLELSIMSSIEHINIVQFYRVHISPNEVEVLMNFCEGGSLKSVGKRTKECNVIVEEKIAGRLAEGVSISYLIQLPIVDIEWY